MDIRHSDPEISINDEQNMILLSKDLSWRLDARRLAFLKASKAILTH